METSSQDVASMMISQEDVLMIEKTVTISQDADSMMINLDVVLMIEKMVSLNQENVLQMTNQIVDMVNKTCKDFRKMKLKSFSYLLEICF